MDGAPQCAPSTSTGLAENNRVMKIRIIGNLRQDLVIEYYDSLLIEQPPSILKMKKYVDKHYELHNAGSHEQRRALARAQKERYPYER
jgi:hypothetical protein